MYSVSVRADWSQIKTTNGQLIK